MSAGLALYLNSMPVGLFYLEVNLLLQVDFLVSAKMSFIALNVLNVERFISGKQKRG